MTEPRRISRYRPRSKPRSLGCCALSRRSGKVRGVGGCMVTAEAGRFRESETSESRVLISLLSLYSLQKITIIVMVKQYLLSCLVVKSSSSPKAGGLNPNFPHILRCQCLCSRGVSSRGNDPPQSALDSTGTGIPSRLPFMFSRANLSLHSTISLSSPETWTKAAVTMLPANAQNAPVGVPQRLVHSAADER